MAKPLHCVVVTPEQTVLEQSAEFIALPLFDGEIGIAPGHSPMIGRMGYGELRIRSGGTTTSYYVDGGFVQVADDMVSVLTNRAIPARNLNAAAAEQQLSSAMQRPANTAELLDVREREVAQARAQVRIARRARM